MTGMSDSARARPRQLSTALWLVVVGSAFQVLSVFDRMSTLNSVDTREEIAKVLGSGSGPGLGLSVDQALTGMRVGLTVSALCAAAAVVLGIFALQRHRGARVALTVLAVPVLATAPLTGGLVGAVVAAAIASTWTGPARDWFAGRPVRERPASSESPPPPVPPPAPAEQPPSRHLSTDETSTAPRPVQGFGSAPVHAPVLERPGPPAPAAYPASPAASARPPVPGTVLFACVVTWLFAGVVALLYALMLVVLVVDRQWIVDRVVASPAWTEAGLKRELLVPVLWLGCVMFLGWSVSAMVLGFFTWRRHNWARYLLVASAATAILAALFAFPFGVPHQIACLYVIWALFTPAAKRWFALPSGASGPPRPGAGPGPGQGPSEPPGGRPPAAPPRGGKPPVW